MKVTFHGGKPVVFFRGRLRGGYVTHSTERAGTPSVNGLLEGNHVKALCAWAGNARGDDGITARIPVAAIRTQESGELEVVLVEEPASSGPGEQVVGHLHYAIQLRKPTNDSADNQHALAVRVLRAKHLVAAQKEPGAGGAGHPRVHCEVWCESVDHVTGQRVPIQVHQEWMADHADMYATATSHHRTASVPADQRGVWPAQPAGSLGQEHGDTVWFAVGDEGRLVHTATLCFRLFRESEAGGSVRIGAACVPAARLCINLFPAVKKCFRRLSERPRAAQFRRNPIPLRLQGTKRCEVALEVDLATDRGVMYGGAACVRGLPAPEDPLHPTTAYEIEVRLKQVRRNRGARRGQWTRAGVGGGRGRPVYGASARPEQQVR